MRAFVRFAILVIALVGLQIEVAVKVKTSAKARSEFYRTLPANLPRKVLAFLIKPETSDEEIRSTFFRTVEGVCNVVKD
jgi:hypothetical protein